MIELSPKAMARPFQDYLGYRFLAREFEDGFNYTGRLEPHKFSFEIGCQIDMVEQSPEIISTDLLKRLLRSFNMNRVQTAPRSVASLHPLQSSPSATSG